jgi:predicted DsbA family dithiol-disulfide isomerase
MTGKLLVEVFASLPPCSGGRLVRKMMKVIEEKYGDRVEIKIYEGINEKVEEYGIETTPAIVIDEDIRIIGVAPSMETLENALKEAGL